MRLAKYIVLVFSFLLGSVILFAQQESKEQLQKRTDNLLGEIETLKQQIASAEKEKKASIAVLRAVEKKLSLRNQLITNYKTQVWMTEKEIIRTYRDIDTLKKEIDILKDQYAQSIVYAYKNRSNYDLLNFLFSSGSIGDVMKRLTYLKNYREFRAQKAGDIVRSSDDLKKKIESLTVKRKEKQEGLSKASDQLQEIEAEKEEKNAVVNQLRGRENDLRKSMAQREKEKRQVQSAIAAVIKREKEEALRREREDAARRKAADEAAKRLAAQKAAEERAKNTNKVATAPDKAVAGNIPKTNAGATTPVENKETSTVPETAAPAVVESEKVEPKTAPSRPANVFESTPEGLISSQQFEGNKGNLPWPVDKGLISFHYGNNKIPGKTRDIDMPADDVTIETNVGAPVKAIFDGEVVSVFYIGNKQTVLLRHGRYFSSYGHLQSASVAKGSTVKAGQTLGAAASNDDGTGEVWLRIENDVRTYDPETWIRRK